MQGIDQDFISFQMVLHLYLYSSELCITATLYILTAYSCTVSHEICISKFINRIRDMNNTTSSITIISIRRLLVWESFYAMPDPLTSQWNKA